MANGQCGGRAKGRTLSELYTVKFELRELKQNLKEERSVQKKNFE